jgi:hypothetical protein
MEPQMECVLAADAARRTAFAALQPRTTALLQLRTQPKALAGALRELTAEVQQQEPAGMAGCLEYTLLPLLFLIDSVNATRAGSSGAQLESRVRRVVLQQPSVFRRPGDSAAL